MFIQVLSPRKDIGTPLTSKGKKKRAKENEDSICEDSISLDIRLEESRDTSAFVSNLYKTTQYLIKTQ